MQQPDVNPQDLTTQPANRATTAQKMRGKTTHCRKNETPAGNETHGQYRTHSRLRTDKANWQADTVATNRMKDTAKNCVNRQTRQPTALTSCEETHAEHPATATRAHRKLCYEPTEIFKKIDQYIKRTAKLV